MMKSKKLLAASLITAGLIGFGVLFYYSRVANKPVSASVESPEVVAKLFASHTLWQTISGTAKITYLEADGSIQNSFQEEFAYSSDGRAAVVVDQMNGTQAVRLTTFVSDGKTALHVMWDSGTYITQPTDHFMKNLSALPASLSQVEISDGFPVIKRHPMAELSPDPLVDYLFPVGLAQRQGIYKVTGTEEISGRTTTVVEYFWSEKDVLPAARYWVDDATGIILQVQNLSQEIQDLKYSEITITSFNVDQPIDPLIVFPQTDGLKPGN